jgi:hypothetical protein
MTLFLISQRSYTDSIDYFYKPFCEDPNLLVEPPSLGYRGSLVAIPNKRKQPSVPRAVINAPPSYPSRRPADIQP